MNPWIKNGLGLFAIVCVVLVTGALVRRAHKPGQLDVLTAQAMDMSQMRPPSGAAPVALASVRQGSLADTVTYTGSVLALNEQDLSPRITGTLVSLPVYPGDRVRAGQVVARLDTAEIGAKAAQAVQEASQAQIGAQVAQLTHQLHHQAALDVAQSEIAAATQGVSDAQAQAQAASDGVAGARSEVQSAQANGDYWKTEIVREKQLADAGAASQQEYQNELAQAQAAGAAVNAAQAKVRQALATAQSGRAKVQKARRQVDTARANERMAQADIVVAEGQARQAQAGAAAARAAAREANVVEGYSQIASPANGLVLARPVAPGTLVQPGTTILRIAEIDRVRVQANVAVEDMAGIHVGSPVRIRSGDGGVGALTAQVTSVFPAADAQTRTAIVEAIVPNPAHRLLPGAFVTMQITSGAAADKLLVPATAITSENGVSSVWTAAGGGGAATQAGQVYECVICHMHYTAARAAALHYHDPMDGGRLVPLRASASPAPAGGLVAHRVTVQAGASDGAWTEVSSAALSPGTRVVTHGQAGLSEGGGLAATAWGTDGPLALPTAASADAGQTVYRCEKCGMTYSAADAAKHHYVDPMDGGKLVPVAPAPSPTGMGGMKM